VMQLAENPVPARGRVLHCPQTRCRLTPGLSFFELRQEPM
jgi:hypothetical protein